MCRGGGGGNSTDYGAINQQQQQAEQQLKLQQQQWQAAQAAANLAGNVNAQTTQQQINQDQQQNTLENERYQQNLESQGVAQNATGGPSGIKAAATVAGNTLSTNPADAKVQAAGLAIPGVDTLTNFLKQRSLSQSNNIGGSNNISSSGAYLGA